MKKLYRSRDNKMLMGVCGGIAEYFNIDPTIVRIIFLFVSFGGGFGILAYIALSVIMPERPYSLKDGSRSSIEDEYEREFREYTNKEKDEEDFY